MPPGPQSQWKWVRVMGKINQVRHRFARSSHGATRHHAASRLLGTGAYDETDHSSRNLQRGERHMVSVSSTAVAGTSGGLAA